MIMKHNIKMAAAAACAMLAAGCADNSDSGVELIPASRFEAVVDSVLVSLYTLRCGDLTMQVTNFGGRVVALWTPDRDGRMADVVLGYDNLAEYIDNPGERFLGAVVGPVANRIADARFSLDGVEYTLTANDNGQTLHGGYRGLDMMAWRVDEAADDHIVMTCAAADGQGGFPGNRIIRMTYTLTPDNEFRIDYSAWTDVKTVINLSHHSFFNLRGEGGGSICDHLLTIPASHITPVDGRLIPTGELMPVEGTPFDFRTPTAIGARIDSDHEQLRIGRGYDMNWCLDRADDGEVRRVAELYDPESGRVMEVLSDQIGLQFYSGNFFDSSTRGKSGRALAWRESVVLETQRYPDAPNHADFPSIELQPGDCYRQTCIYKFSTK